jgi:superoxide dismutase, Cu-Zn family
VLLASVLASVIFSTARALAQVPPVSASADVRDASGRPVASAEFREGRGEVLITINFPTPVAVSGTHAMHIQEAGRCEGPDFLSSGADFNPTNKQHGRLNPDGPRIGDLPNINFANGLTSYNTSATGATLGQGPTSLLSPSRALVLYAGQDDQRSDPDGNVGARIACGVIVAATTPLAAAPVTTAPVASAPAAPVATAPLATAPVARPSPVVPVGVQGTPEVVAAVPVSILAQPVALPATQASGRLSPGTALLVALAGVGLICAGYLLRRRSRVS